MLRSSTFAYIALVLCCCNNTITISVYILYPKPLFFQLKMKTLGIIVKI